MIDIALQSTASAPPHNIEAVNNVGNLGQSQVAKNKTSPMP